MIKLLDSNRCLRMPKANEYFGIVGSIFGIDYIVPVLGKNALNHTYGMSSTGDFRNGYEYLNEIMLIFKCIDEFRAKEILTGIDFVIESSDNLRDRIYDMDEYQELFDNMKLNPLSISNFDFYKVNGEFKNKYGKIVSDQFIQKEIIKALNKMNECAINEFNLGLKQMITELEYKAITEDIIRNFESGKQIVKK